MFDRRFGITDGDDFGGTERLAQNQLRAIHHCSILGAVRRA